MLQRPIEVYCRLSRMADQLAAAMTVTLVSLFTIVVLLQVFMRYVMSSALPWPEEFARYALVWLTFIAGSCALRRGFHVGIDFFVELLPSLRLRAFIKLLTIVVLVFLFVVMITFAIELAERASRRTTPGMKVSQAWFHIGVVIGSVFMLIQAVEHGLRALLALIDPDAEAGRAKAITSSDLG